MLAFVVWPLIAIHGRIDQLISACLPYLKGVLIGREIKAAD